MVIENVQRLEIDWGNWLINKNGRFSSKFINNSWLQSDDFLPGKAPQNDRHEKGVVNSISLLYFSDPQKPQLHLHVSSFLGLVVDPHDTVQIAVLQHTVEEINKKPSLLPNTKLQGINVSLTTDSALTNSWVFLSRLIDVWRYSVVVGT